MNASKQRQTVEFVRHENIKRFKERLAETTDDNERKELLRLLADEEANLPERHTH